VDEAEDDVDRGRASTRSGNRSGAGRRVKKRIGIARTADAVARLKLDVINVSVRDRRALTGVLDEAG
jgi:hypothetical protein